MNSDSFGTLSLLFQNRQETSILFRNVHPQFQTFKRLSQVDVMLDLVDLGGKPATSPGLDWGLWSGNWGGFHYVL